MQRQPPYNISIQFQKPSNEWGCLADWGLLVYLPQSVFSNTELIGLSDFIRCSTWSCDVADAPYILDSTRANSIYLYRLDTVANEIEVKIDCKFLRPKNVPQSYPASYTIYKDRMKFRLRR